MSEYIRFGSTGQRIWLLNEPNAKSVEEALSLRGHQHVERSIPTVSYRGDAKDVWDEAREFARKNDLPCPPEVHVAFTENGPHKSPAFASLDPGAVDKAVEAVRFAQPTWELVVEKVSVPE